MIMMTDGSVQTCAVEASVNLLLISSPGCLTFTEVSYTDV